MVPTERIHRLSYDEFESLSLSALRAAGANSATAASLTRSILGAESRHRPVVGAAHLLDYLEALRAGRINGDAVPNHTAGRASVITVDADDGIAQLAFDHAFEHFVARAHDAGVAVMSVRNAYSGGEIGYYAARAAEEGLVALACGNSSALMATHSSTQAVTGTNPLAFALPHRDGPRLFDQAASATAWVKIRDAAKTGESIPAGWAIDADGEPTTDAATALDGALLPFGGIKGGNIALMIEMLATLAGGSFSLDAAPFDSGTRPPRLGVFVLAIDPGAFDPNYEARAASHLNRLSQDHDIDFARRKPPPSQINVSDDVYRALRGDYRSRSSLLP